MEDGDGIRTTVFLKGCPLSCLWCHNPEGRGQEKCLSFQAERCMNCRRCETACLNSVHVWNQNRHFVEYDKCSSCGCCISVCPQRCLELIGKETDSSWLARELLKDHSFWGTDGGVTFSGGEPLFQADAVLETGKQLKKEGCHITIETCGYAPRQAVEKVMQTADAWLFDFKAGAFDKHLRLCGQGNRIIWDNFRFLYHRGVKLTIRYPLIPGINDDKEDLEALYHLLRDTSMEIPVQIMPYHIMGKGKAERIGQIYPEMLPVQDAPEAIIARKAEDMRRIGIRAFY